MRTFRIYFVAGAVFGRRFPLETLSFVFTVFTEGSIKIILVLAFFEVELRCIFVSQFWTVNVSIFIDYGKYYSTYSVLLFVSLFEMTFFIVINSLILIQFCISSGILFLQDSQSSHQSFLGSHESQTFLMHNETAKFLRYLKLLTYFFESLT